MSATIAILDGYTVEPSGLGVPPYLSAYVRGAYSALRKAYPSADVRYVTIDDVRWCLNGGAPSIAPPRSDPRTYSATVNRDRAIQVLCDANVVMVVAGDKVPSVHLHAENATTDELARALACVRPDDSLSIAVSSASWFTARYVMGAVGSQTPTRATWPRSSPAEMAS